MILSLKDGRLRGFVVKLVTESACLGIKLLGEVLEIELRENMQHELRGNSQKRARLRA
jgi:hypothetical protein